MRDTVIVAISAFGLIGCMIFMMAYHRQSGGAWRKSEIGVWLMLGRLNLTLIFALIISGRVFGDFPGRDYAVITLVGLFALQTFWPIKFIWHPTVSGAHSDVKETTSDSRT